MSPLRDGSVSAPPAPAGSEHAARFALRFALFASIGFAVYGFPYAADSGAHHFFERYCAAYARVVAGVLSAFEPGVSTTGNLISGKASLQVVRSCDAMDANILIVAAIAAFTGSRTRKLVAILAALALIAALNVTRIVSLYFVLLAHPEAFEILHLEVWPLLLLLATAAAFVVATRYLGNSA